MPLFSDIARLEEEGRAFVLCTVTDSHGSTPQKPGSKLVVVEGGQLFGTIGGGAVEKQVVDAALALLADGARWTQTLETHLTHDLGMCCGGAMTVFLEKHGATPKLLLLGGGHVAKALAPLAHGVGFQVTVADARPGFATPERFPGATCVTESPDDVSRALAGGPDVYVAVATHDHPLDQACVEALLTKSLAWLGVIGSERKAAKFRQRLTQKGFTDGQLATMESPMGLQIGALTPEEIAVSIVARLVAVRRRAASR